MDVFGSGLAKKSIQQLYELGLERLKGCEKYVDHAVKNAPDSQLGKESSVLTNNQSETDVDSNSDNALNEISLTPNMNEVDTNDDSSKPLTTQPQSSSPSLDIFPVEPDGVRKFLIRHQNQFNGRISEEQVLLVMQKHQAIKESGHEEKIKNSEKNNLTEVDENSPGPQEDPDVMFPIDV